MKERIIEDMKTALKAGQKERLSTIRMILAAIKQKEIDERIVLDETHCLQILNKLAKQHTESIAQYSAAGRDDLSAKEQTGLDIIRAYLPTPLDEQAIDKHIHAAIAETHADSIKDMGKVMQMLQSQLQGRADIRKVSDKVKSLLGTGT